MYSLCWLIILSSSVVAQQIITPKQVTIDAAFRYEGDVFLISGDEYMRLSPGGFERYVRLRLGDSEVPITANLQAAVAWPLKPLVYFYDSEFSYKNNQTDLTTRVMPYGRYREFLQDGGPDAAAFKSGKFYIFRGCQFVAQVATLWKLGDPQPINSLGLPCDIDAAWTDTDRRGMTVLKGNQIWIWRDDTVQGPILFDDVYHMWTWTLTPSLNDIFHL